MRKTATSNPTLVQGALNPASSLVHVGDTPSHPSRVSVARAYKMFVNGAFVRSESGRYLQVERSESGRQDADAATVNVPRASRKDVRDAVLAAKSASAGWEKRAPFGRGQILYRLAEMMEGRSLELCASLERAGTSKEDAALEVSTSIDRVIYYAGFADKLASLLASHNPVSGPHFTFTIPEPMGVIGVLAPESPGLLGLVSTVVPVIAAGNACIAIASERDPRTAIVWAECLATSDLPAGVVNVLTGFGKELMPQLAKHREVNGIDAWCNDRELVASLERDGAESVKRVKVHVEVPQSRWFDDARGQGISWMERFTEAKTIWHPIGV